MRLPSSFSRSVLSSSALACVLLAALAACSDESEPGSGSSSGDTTSSSGGGSSGALSSSGTGGSSGTLSSSSGGGSSGTLSSSSGGSSSGDVVTAVRTATVTWNGVTTTVAATVTRNFVQAQPLERSVNVPKSAEPAANAASFACNAAASPEKGGRAISVTSLGIAGNFGGSCSGNLARFTAAEQNIASFARNQCNGKNACAYNPIEAFQTYLGECPSSNVLFGWQYRCNPLVFAPALTLAASADGHTFMVSAMDGAGRASSAEREARYVIDDVEYVADLDGDANVIDLTARTERTLTGTVDVALLRPDQPDVRQRLTISFQDEDNTIRQSAVVHMGNDICTHNNVTRSEREVEGAMAKVYSTFDQPLTCIADPARQVPGFELIRLPANNPNGDCGEFRLRMKVGDVIKESIPVGDCQAYVISETEDRFAAEIYNVTLCAAGQVNCETRAVLAISADERVAP